LAETGYLSQQTSEPDLHLRPDNLWQTVNGAYKAHGRFDARAKSFSVHAWINTHRWLSGALTCAVLGTLAAWHYARPLDV
jgi:hypothetical protein